MSAKAFLNVSIAGAQAGVSAIALYSSLSSNACHAAYVSVVNSLLAVTTYPSDSAAFNGTLGHLIYPVWRVSLERSPEMCTFSMRVTGFSAKRRHSVSSSLESPPFLVALILKYWYGVVAFTSMRVHVEAVYVLPLNSVSLYQCSPSFEPRITPSTGARAVACG